MLVDRKITRAAGRTGRVRCNTDCAFVEAGSGGRTSRAVVHAVLPLKFERCLI